MEGQFGGGLKHGFMKKNVTVKWGKFADEILAHLQQDDPGVTKEMLLMMAKLTVIDPKNKFLLRQPAVPLEMERLKKLTIDKFKSLSNVNKDTIKMQLYYREKCQHKDVILDELRKVLDEKFGDFMTEVVNSVPKHRRHHELYFHKLVAATIIYSRMEFTDDLSAIMETEVALKSVFSKDDIQMLLNMNHKERMKELRNIIQMAIGVRLYNKDMDPSLGSGIEDYTTTIPNAIAEIIRLSSEMRKLSVTRLIRYTTAIRPYFMEVEIINRNGRRDVASHMVWVRQGLIMVHQILIYLKELSEELTVEDTNCSYLLAAYKKTMDELKSIIKDQTSLPTHIIAPKFVELAVLWDKLYEAKYYVDQIAELIDQMEAFAEPCLKVMDPLVNRLLASTKVPHEKEFFDYPKYNLPNDTKGVARKKEFRPEMDTLSMEYSGFCVYSLVKGMGLVVLSNPNLGVYSWQGREYTLSTPQAAIEFRRNPAQFVDKVVHFVRRWPTLIHLLKTDKDAFNSNVMGDGDKNNVAATALVTKQIETQTDVHPMESNIVEGYTWNEFELRRKAMILSRIHKCSTHGTQTHWQALKKNECTQTFMHKNSQAQTNSDVATSLPMNQFYLYGLRGYNCGIPPHVIELVSENAQDYGCLCSTKIKSKSKRNKS